MRNIMRRGLVCSALVLLLVASGCAVEDDAPDLALPAPVAPTVEATVAPAVEATVAPAVEATVAPTVEATVAPTVEAEVEDESGYWSNYDQSPLHPGGFTVRTALGEMWPRFRPDVSHYAVKCLTGGDVAVASHDAILSKESDVSVDARTKISVQGAPVAFYGRTYGSVRNDRDDDDLSVQVRRGDDVAEYTVHCLPADFPNVEARNIADPDDTLYAVKLAVGARLRGEENWPNWSYMSLVDRNGVPRWQRRHLGQGTMFKIYTGDGVRAVWSERIGKTDDPWNKGRWILSNYRIALADADFAVQARVSTVGLLNTDAHDFNITPDGNYLLLAYEPAQRDLTEFGDYSETEATHDSVVQIVSPEGDLLFHWNSWGNIPIADCVSHRFPPDYSHINSAVMTDGNVLVSLRGCHRVMLLDGDTGETIWSVGETVLDGNQYAELGLRPPLRVVGDPLGRFCGQHSAHLLERNRLLLFDNQAHCPSDKQYGPYSRVVEYEIDVDAGVARYIREHSMFGSRDVLTGSLGSVEVMPNGNWLIAWGRRPADVSHGSEHERPPASLEDVDPDTNETITAIRFSYGQWPSHIPVRAWPVTTQLLPEPIVGPPR